MKKKINTVKKLRFFLSLNQSELAEKLGVTQQYISEIENSDNPPQKIIDQLEKWLREEG